MSNSTPLAAKLALLLLAAFSTLLLAQQVPTNCATELEDIDDAGAALSYLKQERQNLDRECMIRAMHTIALHKYSAGIATLVDYLDYEIPRKGYAVRAEGVTWGRYPAADALALLGQKCAAPLRSVLADDDMKLIERTNAAIVLLGLASDKTEVIRAIMRAADAAQQVQVANDLKKLAEDMAT